MAKVSWSEPALADLKILHEYISQDSPIYAERFVLSLISAPHRLETFSECGRIVPEFERHDIRELIHGGYRIVYQIRDDHCYILAVVHGSREILRHIDPGNWIID